MERRSHSRPRRNRFFGAIAVAGTMLAGMLAPTAAFAAAPPAGTYAGPSDAYNGATVEFNITASGDLVSFDSESYMYCGGFPTPMTWAGIPATTVTADVPMNIEWTFSDVEYELTNFVVRSDGTASGSGRASMPDISCFGMEFDFSATLQGGIPDPDPVYDPSLEVTPAELTLTQLANEGVELFGEGFAPGSTVDFYVDGAIAATRSANDNGEAWTTFTSTSLTPGSYAVVVSSVDGDASGSFTVTEDPVVYNPEVTVAPDEVTESELAETGVTVSGTGFVPNATIQMSVAQANVGEQTANADGDVTFTLLEPLAPGVHTVVLSDGEHEASASLTVTEDPVVFDPSLTVNPSEVTQSELASAGVDFAAEGFVPGSSVEFTVHGDAVATEVADEDGEAGTTFTSDALAPGSYSVVASSVDGEVTASLTVTEDPVVYNPEVTVPVSEFTQSDIATVGATIEGTGFPANVTVSLTVAGEAAGSETTDASGDVSFVFTSDTIEPGVHTVVLSDGEHEASASLTVTEDPVVFDPSLTVNPSEVTQSELASDGVDFVAEGFVPGSSVEFTVHGDAVATEVADEDGEAGTTFTSDALAPGSYSVVASSVDGEVTASLTVTEDPVVYDPTIDVSATQVTLSELASAGIMVTGHGFEPGSDIELTVGPEWGGTDVVDADGNATFTFMSDTLEVGSHDVTLATATAQVSTTLTVTEDDPVYTPSIRVYPSEISLRELANWGFDVEGEGFPPNADVTLLVNGEEVATVHAGDDGRLWTYHMSTSLEIGSHTVALQAGDLEVSSSISVVADPPPPAQIPEVAPVIDDLDPGAEGGIVVPDSATAGTSITVEVPYAYPGMYVGVWMFSDPVYLGTHEVSEEGTVTVTIPADTAGGVHSIAVWTEYGELLGWDTTLVEAAPVPTPDPGVDPETPEPGTSETPTDGLVNTGDMTAPMVAALGALLMIAGLALSMRRRRRLS